MLRGGEKLPSGHAGDTFGSGHVCCWTEVADEVLAVGVAEHVGPVGWEDSVAVCVRGAGAAGTPGLDGCVLSATQKPGRRNSQLRGRGLAVARKNDIRG